MRRSTLILLALLVAAVAVRLWLLPPPAPSADTTIDPRSLYPEVTQLIREHYVDEVDPRYAFQAAYSALLREVDSYCAYISPEGIPADREVTSGEGFWAGFWIRPEEGGFVISRILPASPAEQSPMKVGDILFSVDGLNLARQTWWSTLLLLHASGPHTFRVRILRKNTSRPREITIPAVHLPPAVTTRTLPGGILHVTLFRISSQAVETLSRLLAESREKKKWIIDLRSYISGDLTSCLSLADLILASPSRMDLRTRSGLQHIRAGGRGERAPGLVGVTGAATIMYAELLAHLMQAAGTPLVGTATGGFVAHLRREPLPDGGLLLLTDGYYRRDGKNISGRPLIPGVLLSGEDSAVEQAQNMLREI